MSIQAKSILLVEDNPADVRLIQEMLAEAWNHSFDIKVVDRIRSAQNYIRVNKVSVVLLDLGLPDGQGLDALRALNMSAPQVPIVVLAGVDEEILGVKAVKEGAQDCLVKDQVDSRLIVRAMRYAIERHRLQSELRRLAITDVLTGLYNRRGFIALAEQQLKLARRMRLGVLLLYIDLDGLKNINDTLGHQQGDHALVEIADLLRRTYRESDVIARLGGDEFVVLAMKTGKTEPILLINSLQRVLEDFNQQIVRPYRLAVSIGVAHYTPGRPSSIDDLLTEADQDLYKQKRGKWGEK